MPVSVISWLLVYRLHQAVKQYQLILEPLLVNSLEALPVFLVKMIVIFKFIRMILNTIGNTLVWRIDYIQYRIRIKISGFHDYRYVFVLHPA